MVATNTIAFCYTVPQKLGRFVHSLRLGKLQIFPCRMPTSFVSLYSYWCKLISEPRDFFFQDGRNITVNYPSLYDLATTENRTGSSASILGGSRHFKREI